MTDGGFNAYAAGNPVYNGGSPNPTSGTLDPSGYITRGLNTPSGSRSGLAAAALSRIRGVPQYANDPNAPSGVQAIGPAPVIGGDPLSAGPQQVSSTVGGANSPAAQAINQRQVPQQSFSPIAPLRINPLGQIQLPQQQSLALDADLSGQVAADTNSANNTLAGLEQQINAVGQQYATSAQQQQSQEPNILNALQGAFAGRGMGFSSGYGRGVETEGDRFTSALSNLLSGAQNNVNNLQNQQSQVPINLQSLIQQLLGTQATRNIVNAGSLGIGQ